MIEADAQAWIATRHGETGLAAMRLLIDLVKAESAAQNLVAPSTLNVMWARHVVDSAQLIDLVARYGGSSGAWLDIGSGAGFPGLVVAALTDRAMILVEPRARRADFLRRGVAALGLTDRVKVLRDRVENIADAPRNSVISARAVASLSMLFDGALHCTTADAIWVLPKGRSALEEVATAKQTWHGVFHVERSVTDPASLIVLASGVRRK